MSTSPPASPNRGENPPREEEEEEGKKNPQKNPTCRKDNSAFEKSVVLALKLQRLVDYSEPIYINLSDTVFCCH